MLCKAIAQEHPCPNFLGLSYSSIIFPGPQDDSTIKQLQELVLQLSFYRAKSEVCSHLVQSIKVGSQEGQVGCQENSAPFMFHNFNRIF